MFRIVFGIADSRSAITRRCSNLYGEIIEHVCKVIIYGNSGQCYNHWIEEISSYINRVNSFSTSGTRTGKLKYKDYEEHLFGIIGGYTVASAEADLEDFQLRNRKKIHSNHNPYPDFEIDEDMINRMYRAYDELVKECCQFLSTRNKYRMADIAKITDRILNRYCNK